MFTKNLKDQFSADLLKAVEEVLEEGKGCKDCGCKKCECEDDDEDEKEEKDEMKESQQIDELSKNLVRRYINKSERQINKLRSAKYVAWNQGNDKAGNAFEKKQLSREKMNTLAKNKMNPKVVHATEEVEQIDELSKKTLGSYVNKAAERIGTQGVTAGLKIAADEKSKKNFDNMGKRQKGIVRAVNKLTKEEQEFIDSLNADNLEEGRGRPPKEGSAAWHAKQKQENDDMIALGAQLRKAKSMNKKVRFMNGKEHEIHPNHIDRFEDHMAARKTSQDKAAFQKQAHKSHEDFVKAVTAPVPKAHKDTGEIVKYRH